MSICKFQSKCNFSTPAVFECCLSGPIPGYMETHINSLISQSWLNRKLSTWRCVQHRPLLLYQDSLLRTLHPPPSVAKSLQNQQKSSERVKIARNSEKLGFYSPEVFDKSKPKDSLKTASFFSAMACISWTKRKANITNLFEPHPFFNFQQSLCSAIVFPLIHPCPLSNVGTCNDDNRILG